MKKAVNVDAHVKEAVHIPELLREHAKRATSLLEILVRIVDLPVLDCRGDETTAEKVEEAPAVGAPEVIVSLAQADQRRIGGGNGLVDLLLSE